MTTAHAPIDVAALVVLLMSCTYWAGRIVEREKAARRRRTATATRYRNN
jgi:hypothetical protein